MTAPNTPTPELEFVERLRKEIPYNADGFRELRDLADEAAAAIAKLTAERDALQRWKDVRAAEITDDQKRMAALEAERDASGDELGRVVLACPTSPRYRMHPTSAGVRNLRKDFEAAENRVKELEASLTIALNDVVLHDMVAQGERSANKLLSERVAVLEAGLQRLASPEAFTVPRMANEEEQARMHYADDVLRRALAAREAK